MTDHVQSANRLIERIHAVVRSSLERAGLSHVIVACSGGADSICLLHAVATVAGQTGQRVTVGHVRHGVRVDDVRDADLVQSAANHLAVESRVISLHRLRADYRQSPSEAEMRDARYRALAALADEVNADAVLTGHTLDDQAETVLLHLVRGTGVDGLGGMAEETLLPIARDARDEREHQLLRVIRPLLSVRRGETVAYCGAHDLTVVSDPTNDDVRYTRNWMRHTVLPMLRERNPDVAATLCRAASTLRDDAAFLSEQTALALARCGCQTEKSSVHMSRSAFRSEHVALQRRILRESVQRITGRTPRADDVDAARHHMVTSRSSTIRHFGGVACCLAFDQVVLGCDDAIIGWMREVASRRFPLSRGVQVVRDDTKVHLALSDPSIAAYDFQIVPAFLRGPENIGNDIVATPLRLPDSHTAVIRNRLPTDRFWPKSSKRPTLLRDYLSARGVPAPVRDFLPLFVVNGTIAWVIGHDVGTEFTATDATATHFGILRRLAR